MVEIITFSEKKQIQIFTEELGNGVELELVQIPSGRFIMGAPASEIGSHSSERPQHEVRISSFLTGRYPITQRQWQAIAKRNDLKKDRDLNPDPSSFKKPYQGRESRGKTSRTSKLV